MSREELIAEVEILKNLVKSKLNSTKGDDIREVTYVAGQICNMCTSGFDQKAPFTKYLVIASRQVRNLVTTGIKNSLLKKVERFHEIISQVKRFD